MTRAADPAELARWTETVAPGIRSDPLWRMEAYRLALFLAERAWADVSVLAADRRTLRVSPQLLRAIGSISANLAEGYTRRTGPDRAGFYEYALGSAREARCWYHTARPALSEITVVARLGVLTSIARLITVVLPHVRHRAPLTAPGRAGNH